MSTTSAPRYEPVPDDALPQEHLAALEAVLMVVDEPVPAARLAAVLGLPTGQVVELLTELAADFAGERGTRPRGYRLREVGGGWRVYSAAEYAEIVGRFVVDGQTARLTQASLETLAVIAYRQPVSRGRVAAIRGVNVDGVVRTLLTRGLIEEMGHDDDGGAVLYGTTNYFLERMGMTTLADLPPLAPYLPDLEMLGELDGDVR
ncbi:SMC-Scp complex subunit ScpB [Georgenia wangjunii]|uniref:SMC-Scp complex subunit ScpB n=1 Tax=Georgenia wangjunii TaxID=3117730 RepID=UPI002F26BF47